MTESTLSENFNKNTKLDNTEISGMFDFKYKEDIENCFRMLNISPLISNNTRNIDVKTNDGLIDLSPCIGIYQEAMYFKGYDIDKEIDLYIELNKNHAFLWNDEMKAADLEKKILFLVSLDTNQNRYLTQVELPFVNHSAERLITERLKTRLNPNDSSQVACKIDFAEHYRGTLSFSSKGFADVVKNNIVYELKFVSELTHEHFLQCACYIVALGLKKGILWNTRDNKAFEITIPNKKAFLDSVVNTITKEKVNKYYKPINCIN